MKTFLKVLGYVFAVIAILGGGQSVARFGICFDTVAPILFYVGLSVLCFWGARKLNKSNKQQ